MDAEAPGQTMFREFSLISEIVAISVIRLTPDQHSSLSVVEIGKQKRPGLAV